MAAIVTFDPINLRIVEINTGLSVNTLSAVEIYSEWKDWLLADPARLGYPQAFVQIAEEFTVTEDIGPYFFLGNGWKIRPAEYSHKLVVDGTMISSPTTESIFVPTLGAYTVHTETKVSAISSTKLVQSVTQADVDLLKYLGAVWIDSNNGTAGTTVGVNGTPTNPVLSLADAETIAATTGLRAYVIVDGAHTLTAGLTEWSVELRGESSLDFNGQSVNGSSFTGVGTVEGTMSGTINVHNCKLGDITSFVGHADGCGIAGTITLGAGTSSFVHCHSEVPGNATPTLNFGGAGRSVNVRFYSGGLKVEGMTDATNKATLEYVAGQCIIDGSCSAGELVLRGIIEPVTDNSTGTTVNTSAVLPRAVATAWDAQLSAHVQSGSAGKALLDLFVLLGLDPTKPLVVSETQRSAGDITQDIAEAPAGTFTATRQP